MEEREECRRRRAHRKIDKASDGEDWGYHGLRNFYNNVIKGDQVIPRTHFSSFVSGMFMKIDLRPYTSKAKLEFLVLKLKNLPLPLNITKTRGFPGLIPISKIILDPK